VGDGKSLAVVSGEEESRALYVAPREFKPVFNSWFLNSVFINLGPKMLISGCQTFC
jgi:hypothetical protein